MTRRLTGAVASFLVLLAGFWLVLAPFALGIQPRTGDWKDQTLTDVWTGLALALVGLVGFVAFVAALHQHLTERGLVARRVLQAPEPRSAPEPAAAPAAPAAAPSELDKLLAPLVVALTEDLARERRTTGQASGQASGHAPGSGAEPAAGPVEAPPAMTPRGTHAGSQVSVPAYQDFPLEPAAERKEQV